MYFCKDPPYICKKPVGADELFEGTRALRIHFVSALSLAQGVL